MIQILVLCTGNSARSQLAEGYLRYFADDRARVFSAGVDPKGVNPLAVQVMAEDGINISNHTSNHADEYADFEFDYVLTVCDNAREQCPVYSSAATKIHHSFPDPGHDPNEDAITSFRNVRDMIKEYSREFVAKYLADGSETLWVIENARHDDRDGIIRLLQKVNLPTSDLPASLTDFLATKYNGEIIGTAGIERFGLTGLLRSVAVDPAFQKSGIAGNVLNALLEYAAKIPLRELYLITNTADAYFRKLGFQAVDRQSAPIEIQQTPQFSGLCPSSSVVMKFEIKTENG